jgi:hypothetical protein
MKVDRTTYDTSNRERRGARVGGYTLNASGIGVTQIALSQYVVGAQDLVLVVVGRESADKADLGSS